jgi:hypothetical protein
MVSVVVELDEWDAEWSPNVYVAVSNIRNETEGGPFDKSFLRCIGQQAIVNGKFSSSGTCTETDMDGDKVFITSVSDAFTFIGGTGKYKGITGGGTYKGEPVVQREKEWAVYVTYESHWEIKPFRHGEGTPL